MTVSPGTSRRVDATTVTSLPDLLPPPPGLPLQVLRSRPVSLILSATLFLATWYGAIELFSLPPYVVPTPHAVLATLIERAELLRSATWVTAKEILAAFGLAIAIGVPLGILLAFSAIADRLIYPLLVGAQAVPKVALAPVFLAWFGFGFQTNVTIGFLIAFFPVVVNTVVGLKALDRDLVRLGRALGATPGRLFWRIRLPVALPSMMSGFKLAVTFATIGAIVGEFVAGSEGLGYLVSVAMGNLNSELAFAAVVCVSALSMGLFATVEGIERFLLRAHPQSQPKQ